MAALSSDTEYSGRLAPWRVALAAGSGTLNSLLPLALFGTRGQPPFLPRLAYSAAVVQRGLTPSALALFKSHSMIHEGAASNGQVRPNDGTFSRAFGGARCMNVLLIGSGGREHALAWAILASPLLGKLYCAPGNAGIAEVAECVALNVADHAAVIRF